MNKDIPTRVRESLQEEGNEKVVSEIMQKMMKLYERKHSMRKEEPVVAYGERVWIGNYCFANNQQFLEMNEVRAVASCLEHPLNVTLPNIVYRKFAVKDEADQRFQELVLNFLDFISSQAGNIYVHCFSGKSRSAAFVTALIMRDSKKTYKEALQELRKVYPIAAPNAYFESTLTQMEGAIHAMKKVEQTINLLDEDLSPPPSPKKSGSLIEEKPKSSQEINLLDIEETKQLEPPMPFDYLQQPISIPLQPATQQVSVPQQAPDLINIFETGTIEVAQQNEGQLLDLHQEPAQPTPIPTPTPEHNDLIDLTAKTQSTDLDILEQEKVEKKEQVEEEQFVDSTDFTQKKKKNKKKKK